jgi:hypothetical protein
LELIREVLDIVIDLCPGGHTVAMSTDNTEIYAHLGRVGSGQAVEEEAEKWRSISNMMRGEQHITLTLSDSEESPDFRIVTEEYAIEVLAKVEAGEDVRILGGEPALLSPRYVAKMSETGRA